MKTILTWIICFSALTSFAQDSQDNALNYRKTYYTLGVGPSTIGGLSFLNEIGIAHRQNNFSFRGDLHFQLFGASDIIRISDVFLNVGFTYGRIFTKEDIYYEINFGPVFYGYFDEHVSNSHFLGSTVTGRGVREYAGFGFILKADIGRLGVKKVAIDYSAFMIINTDQPVIGVTANLNLRLRHKELAPKM